MTGKNNKTKIYSDQNKTSLYGDQVKRTKESVHNISAGDKITLNNKEYKVLEIISESTGEAVIYKIEDDQKKILALKLYFEFHDPDQEPNTEAIERIKNIKDPDILNLFDYGTGEQKYEGKYCFEISDFALGNDLVQVEDLKKKYTSDFLEKDVIPQIFNGIIKLHENKIFHCDLKPQNVFYLDNEQTEIVIGDYGSAKTFDYDTEKSSRKTTTVKGTDFYLPPEQARGFISEKNDYYSFGMILLHLFYPDKILTHDGKMLSRQKLKLIIERQFETKPIIDFDPKFKKINRLIEGLTLADFNLRWGKKQVQQHIEGKDLKVQYKSSDIQSDIPLIFGNYTMNTVNDIRDFILNDPDWYSDLIEDEQNKTDFTDWIIKLYGGNRSKRSDFNRIVKEYSQDGVEFVGDALIRFFVPEHPIVFGLKSFDFHKSKDIRKTTAVAFHHLINELWRSSSEKEVKLYLFRFEFSLGQLKGMKDEITEVLNKLYESLKIKKNVKNDFFDHYVDAWYSVTKNSTKNLEKFLCSYLPVDSVLEYLKLDEHSQLHYKIKKSASEYYKQIDINYKLEDSETEELINIKYPQSGYTLKNFFEKTADKTITGICEKHEINKKNIPEQNLTIFKEKLRSDIEKQIEDLSKKFNTFKKKYKRKIKKAPHIKKNIVKLELVTEKKEYHKLNTAFELLKTIENQAKRRVKKLKKGSGNRKLRISDGAAATLFFSLFFLPILTLLLWNPAKKGIFYLKSLVNYEYIDNKAGALEKIDMIYVESEDGSYYISKYEITNLQYSWFLNIYGSNVVKTGKYLGEKMIELTEDKDDDWGIHYTENGWQPAKGYENHPVIYVTWYGANEFCLWAGGRLPTESEWEFAAKGGKESKNYAFSGSNKIRKVAWYYDNSRDKTHPVGKKNFNELGIYDMSGNVSEWCETEGDKADKFKIIKGGHVFSYESETSLEYNNKDGMSRGSYSNHTGFRLCKDSIPDTN